MTFLDYVLPFLLVLGVLIFIHELGHFIAAKAFGVKVERFSLGFGRALVSRTIGETEYRISWLPLGGYVKMLGEVPGEPLPEGEESRTFNGKPVWQRIVIAGAGPAMNFLLPVFLLGGAYLIGVPTATSRVGTVLPDSPAAEAGLRPGDRIRTIDGEPVEWWTVLEDRLEETAPGAVSLVVERGGEQRTLQLAVPAEGAELGLYPAGPAPVVVVRGDGTPAGRVGLRTGDRITRVGDVEVLDWFHLAKLVGRAGDLVEVEVLRAAEGEPPLTLRMRLPVVPGPGALERLGVLPGDLRIQAVDLDSPAAVAGLEPGDVILEADGQPVSSFRALAARIRTGEGRPLKLRLLRESEVREFEIVPEQRDVVQQGIRNRLYAIGVRGGAAGIPELRSRRVANPFAAAALGVGWTVDITQRTFEGIGMLLSGRVGREGLAGPIGIGVIAAQSFQAGWVPGILIMAVISVNLAILNLLPVPVLDGGHIAFALAEGLKGSPVSLRTREFAQQIGIAALLLLMAFAFWNDIARYWSEISGFFRPAP